MFRAAAFAFAIAGLITSSVQAFQDTLPVNIETSVSYPDIMNIDGHTFDLVVRPYHSTTELYRIEHAIEFDYGTQSFEPTPDTYDAVQLPVGVPLVFEAGTDAVGYATFTAPPGYHLISENRTYRRLNYDIEQDALGGYVDETVIFMLEAINGASATQYAVARATAPQLSEGLRWEVGPGSTASGAPSGTFRMEYMSADLSAGLPAGMFDISALFYTRLESLIGPGASPISANLKIPTSAFSPDKTRKDS